jgi:hypothetical protein
VSRRGVHDGVGDYGQAEGLFGLEALAFVALTADLAAEVGNGRGSPSVRDCRVVSVKKGRQRWKAARVNVFRATGAEGDGLDDRLSFEGHANLCIRLFA